MVWLFSAPTQLTKNGYDAYLSYCIDSDVTAFFCFSNAQTIAVPMNYQIWYTEWFSNHVYPYFPLIIYLFQFGFLNCYKGIRLVK